MLLLAVHYSNLLIANTSIVGSTIHKTVQYTTPYMYYVERYARWGCILNCFIPSSLLVFAVLLSLHLHAFSFLHLYTFSWKYEICCTQCSNIVIRVEACIQHKYVHESCNLHRHYFLPT